MTRLLLMRHGITDWNAEHRLQGRTDRPLTDAAREHLVELVVPDAIGKLSLYASPLVRARETAELVFKREPKLVSELTEMHWGAFEGQKGVDLIADKTSGYRHVEEWGWDFRPPGGETPAEVLARLRGWLLGLREDSVAVVHMGVIRVILAEAHGYGFEGAAPFRIKRDRLYGVEIVDGRVSNPAAEFRLRPAP